MVSPIALDIARITDTMIPDEAAGSNTREDVCHLDAPIPYEASRKDLGTAYNASSLKDEIIGMIIMPITMPGERALNPDKPGIKPCKKGVTTVKAKYP